MSATDALTITSALDALTRYYDAKEREENAVLYINDAYLEALNSLEKLEAENAKLRESVRRLMTQRDERLARAEAENAKLRELVEDMLDCIDIQIAFERVPARWMQDEFAGRARELGIEVDG